MVATAPTTPEIATVPRLWPGSTIVCLASGPSLNAADVEYCFGKARVIAIKDTVRLAPAADVLYGCGCDTGQWWPRVGAQLGFKGPKYTLDQKAAAYASALKNTGETGLETDPSGLRTGKNSGFQAINLAVHLGAVRIILLGYDLQASPHGPSHFFGDHPWKTRSPYGMFLPFFETLVQPLKALGIETLNASRVSALTCFPKVTLTEALS